MKLLPQYKPLFTNDTRFFILTSGRGAGKSFHVADFLLKLTYEAGHTILFTRYTMVSAEISIIPEFTQKIEAYNLNHVFHITSNEIVNKLTGSNILFRGIKTSSGNNTAALKSIANVTTFVIDELEDLVDEDTFDTIGLSIRHKTLQNRIIGVMNPSNKNHFVYKRFFENMPYDNNFNGIWNGTTYIHTSYLDNADNLPSSFLEEAERTKRQNPARYNHIFLGEWIDSAEGLLWKTEQINSSRREPQDLDRNQLTRVILAIDPAVTKTARSDETGMIVVGLDRERKVYVLDDVSGHYTPQQWANVAKDTADHWRIDAYVAEGNQGHDLVESNLRSVDPNRRVKMVRATRGKTVRAEPVYGLYEQSKVHHVGFFPKLESQMVSWNPDASVGSPDRVDALVWGVTELIFSDAKPKDSAVRGKARHKPRRM